MNPRLRTAGIASAVVVLDRITKMYIRSQYTSWDVTPVIGGFFNIVHTENPGAAFGILADSPSAWSSMLLHALGESARIPKAAPGFSVCTILKNPPMTGVTSQDVY